MLADDIAAALPQLRAEAEALMDQQFDLGDYGDGWHYDHDFDQEVRDFTVLFSTVGKLRSSTQASEVEVGGRTATTISRTFCIPVGTPAVPVGTIVRRANGTDLRILAEITHPQPKDRKFAVEEALS